jgi:hypothetical protein
MRSSLLLCLAVLLLSIAAAPVLAQVSEPDEGGGGPQPSSVRVEPVLSNSTPAPYMFRKGAALQCGQAEDKRHNSPDISCHINAKITVKQAVASFLGLSSTVIASGVPSRVVDHLMVDDEDEGRVYFLELKQSVKDKLRAKHIRALGVHITGTFTAHTSATTRSPATDKVLCNGAEDPTTSCSIKAGKRTIWPAGDGELVCWRFMPWYLATPARWGKMCPRPHQI